MKHDLIIFAGAPGSGKTTICEILQKKLNCPLIDFGRLREPHLDRAWKKANETEEINQAAEFSKQVEVYFQKSLPYMEAAHAADPKDLYTVNALVQIYTQLNMMDKASEFTKLRSSLQK